MNKINYGISHYKEKRVSLKQAIAVLARNDVEVNEDEATLILDFLYQIATAYYNLKAVESSKTLDGHRIAKKCLNDITSVLFELIERKRIILPGNFEPFRVST